MSAYEVKDGLLSGYLRRERLRRIATFVKAGSVLDIGCDQGFLIPYLSDAVDYFGIDTNAAALETARARYPDYTFERLLLSSDSINQLPHRTFDNIVMAAIIEHLDAPVEILRSLSLKLNRNGRMIITSPHEKSHHLLTWMAKTGLARNDKHEHEHYINHSMIEPLLKQGLLRQVCYKRFQFGMNQLWVIEKA